jgi:hypothetical protein
MKSNAIGGAAPPETIEDAAITVDEASRLMANLGFIAFRTPSSDAIPDSCLMGVIRNTPTRRHFDAETVTYWAMSNGRGQLEAIDRDTSMPVAGRFSWGRIRLVDRFRASNGFATFGGEILAERIGPDARLVIFCSPAPIVRLRGHSQQQDRLADEVLAFFARLTPRLWTSPEQERLVADRSPDVLYAAFLLEAQDRLRPFEAGGDEQREAYWSVLRELELLREHRVGTVDGGADLLRLIGLTVA